MTDGLGDGEGDDATAAGPPGAPATLAVSSCTGLGSDRTYHSPMPASASTTNATNPASSRLESAARRSRMDSTPPPPSDPSAARTRRRRQRERLAASGTLAVAG